MTTTRYTTVWFGLLTAFMLSPANASEPKEIAFGIDNDSPQQTDREYTAGSHFHVRVGHFQLSWDYKLFTPKNHFFDSPAFGQRPYAAYNRIGLSGEFLALGESLFPSLVTLEVAAAETGPQLKGEFIQNFVHAQTLANREDAEDIDPIDDEFNGKVHGWASQVPERQGAQGRIDIETQWDFLSLGPVRLRSTISAEGGNFIRTRSFGTRLLAGVNPPDLSPEVRISNDYALYLDLAFEHVYVDRNVLLQGFEVDGAKYEYAVEPKPEFNKIRLGLVLETYQWEWRLSTTHTSNQYEGQTQANGSRGHQYTTLSLAYRWY